MFSYHLLLPEHGDLRVPEVTGEGAVVVVGEPPASHHPRHALVRVGGGTGGWAGETHGLDVGVLGQGHGLRQHQHGDVVLVAGLGTSVKRIIYLFHGKI